MTLFEEALDRYVEAVQDVGRDRVGGTTLHNLVSRMNEKHKALTEYVEALRLAGVGKSSEDSDLAVAIGEYAFKAGWAACEAWWQEGHTGQEAERLEQAWSEYDPPEELKGRRF